LSGGSVSHQHLGLFDTPPDRRQVRLGLAIAGLLLVVSLPIAIVSQVRLPELEGFVPTIDAIMFLGEAITAAMLYAQAGVFRLRSLAVLGTGYLFTALLLIPHALAFPGAFADDGLLGAGLSTTAWIAMLRKPPFALAILTYAHCKTTDLAAQPDSARPQPRISLHIALALALAVAITLLAMSSPDLLPALMRDRAHIIRARLIACECVSTVLWIAAIVMLYRRRSSILDMWLLVALSGCLFTSLLDMTLPARFTAGFYWYGAVMTFSNLVVLLALISESARLYGRLALSTSAWTREREARLMSIDALTAAIAHEVGQPLAAVGIHANAGLRSLTGERPDAKRAINSMRAAVEAGNLASGILKGVRATFARRPNLRTTFSLTDLVLTTAPMFQRELASERILLELDLDEALSPVLGDQVQLQLVLINLISNAVESLSATKGRPRHIKIRSAPLQGLGMVLEVSDNGAGVAPGDMAHIFEPYFTTKATGAGMGLSLCRIIVEAHGGRLWASHGEEAGAVFHLELPASASYAAMSAPDPAMGAAD
jgi:signal transduction histidine kinase